MQASNHPKAQTIRSLKDTRSKTSAGWEHGNRTGIFGGHGKSMATEDEKLMLGPMGKQL